LYFLTPRCTHIPARWHRAIYFSFPYCDVVPPKVLTKSVEKTLLDFLDRHGSQHLLKILDKGDEKALMALRGIAKVRQSARLPGGS
jgi:hypothetical protein